MAIVLLIKSEDGQTTELPVMGKVSLGRSSSSDYKITDSKMSGQHCAFSISKSGELIFKDLDSTNGSYLNNNKIHQSVVRVNDIIRIGNTLIKIDEKKLTAKERQLVGLTNHRAKEEKTIPQLTEKSLVKANKADKKKTDKKPTIILNKDHLKKKKMNESNWMGGGNENVIEQEESSGMTKMLKLDSLKKKKA